MTGTCSRFSSRGAACATVGLAGALAIGCVDTSQKADGGQTGAPDASKATPLPAVPFHTQSRFIVDANN